jgi:DNA polymerase elongation subunit (family B)
LNGLYLVNATATETNAIKLQFINAKGEIQEFIDDTFKPYFIATHSLTEGEKATVTHYSGSLETIEKIELFTGETGIFQKITWPNPKTAQKAAEKFRRPYENEIDFAKSYIYDKGLVFGALHSETDLKPILQASAEAREKFEKIFQEVETKDPLKHAQISYWFNLLSEPIPNLSQEFFGVKDANQEKICATWTLSRIANIPLVEAFSSRHVSDWIKSIIYTHLRRNNTLIPTSEELRRGKPTHKVTGALTLSPTPGVYFDTVVCDFESLYPSCIDSFNLSYETVDCTHPECRTNKVSDVESHVCTKRRGFYSVLVGALKDLRIKLFKPNSKDELPSEEERRIAGITAKLLKLITVSTYGVTVRIHGLASPPLAEAITGYGRYVLREAWNMTENRGLKPLYGDTDSLFLDKASNYQLEWLIGAVKDKFGLDLAIEKRYNICVLPAAKKAYFGILPNGAPDIKGLTAIKSNSPQYINATFRTCVKTLSTVGNQEEYMQAKREIKKICKKTIDDLKNRNVSLDDLVYSVRLHFDPNEKVENTKMVPQPYQCALQLINAGKRLKRGDVVSFIKVKPFKYKGKIFTVKPADFVGSLAEINVEDYVRNLRTALNQTFKPMGIKLEEEKEADILKWITK